MVMLWPAVLARINMQVLNYVLLLLTLAIVLGVMTAAGIVLAVLLLTRSKAEDLLPPDDE